MSVIAAKAKRVAQTAQLIFSGLLSGAGRDDEIKELIDEDYSADFRREACAEELLAELARLIERHIRENSDAADEIFAAVGVRAVLDAPFCFQANLLSAVYLSKLERAGDFAEPIEYCPGCPMSPGFETTVKYNAVNKSRCEEVTIGITSGRKEEEYCSTLQNLVSERPAFPLGNVCGLYEREPILTNGCDGGLRTMGLYKKDREDLPLITYITIVRNRADVLWRCMASVFSQNHPNIEYIVVDGASTDGTLELIKRFGDKIDYYVSQPDTGLYNAMNRGLKLATGRLICFMNSDDNCLPGGAAVAARISRETGADAVAGNQMLREGSGKTKALDFKRFHIRNCSLAGAYMYHQALFTSFRAFEGIGAFDERYRVISDGIHGSKILGRPDYKTVFTDKPVCTFSLTGISQARRGITMRENVRNLRENFPCLSAKDAEAICYSMQNAGLPPNHYIDFFTMTRAAKKYFHHPDFKRAYYETAMRLLINWYYTRLKNIRLRLDPRCHRLYLLEGYPKGSQNEIFESLIKILEEHCADDNAVVSDENIHELCKLQRYVVKAWRDSLYRGKRRVVDKLKLSLQLLGSKLTAKSNRLTVRAFKRYTGYFRSKE